jgi:polyphosphate kinase 2 (PPK2 family)
MADEFDIPVFKKAYEFYKMFYVFRTTVPKKDKYTIYQKSENLIIEIIEGILSASYKQKFEKIPALERTSLKLNVLRVFIRLMKEIQALDNKKYSALEEIIDEIGRMLGGWIRSLNPK